jgi:hypothetical protein
MKKKERKFKYLEIVIVKENSENNQNKISGLKGTVLGYNIVDGKWIYAVDIEGIEECYGIDESDLLFTGLMNKKSNFYPED